MIFLLFCHLSCQGVTLDTVFLDSMHIILSASRIIEINEAEWEWGTRQIESFGLEDLDNAAKAKKIESFAHEHFRFKIRNPQTIQEIVDLGGGNCLSHSIMGIYLLRLAGVPAKLCYEFQLRKPLFVDRMRANAQKTGIFSSGYNTHVWVFFFDGREWQPFDSTLGITGFKEFFAVRAATKQGPYFLDPEALMGPPFLVLQETGAGYLDMENITHAVWDREFTWPNSKVSRDAWNRFIEPYLDKGYEFFELPLEESDYMRIKEMSKEWF